MPLGGLANLVKLMAGQPGSVYQAGLDVLSLEKGVALQNRGNVLARREKVEDVLHSNASPPQERLPPKNCGIGGDTVEELRLGHERG